jgi:hypothetical protein
VATPSHEPVGRRALEAPGPRPAAARTAQKPFGGLVPRGSPQPQPQAQALQPAQPQGAAFGAPALPGQADKPQHSRAGVAPVASPPRTAGAWVAAAAAAAPGPAPGVRFPMRRIDFPALEPSAATAVTRVELRNTSAAELRVRARLSNAGAGAGEATHFHIKPEHREVSIAPQSYIKLPVYFRRPDALPAGVASAAFAALLEVEAIDEAGAGGALNLACRVMLVANAST